MVEPADDERAASMVGAEETPPPASPAKPATPPPAKPATPPPAPAAPPLVPMAEVNARVAALEDLAKYSLGLNPEPPLGMAGGSRQRENLLMQEINDMRWRLKGLETVESNNRAVTNAANGLRGRSAASSGRSAAARSAAASARVGRREDRARGARRARERADARRRARARGARRPHDDDAFPGRRPAQRARCVRRSIRTRVVHDDVGHRGLARRRRRGGAADQGAAGARRAPRRTPWMSWR